MSEPDNNPVPAAPPPPPSHGGGLSALLLIGAILLGLIFLLSFLNFLSAPGFGQLIIVALCGGGALFLFLQFRKVSSAVVAATPLSPPQASGAVASSTRWDHINLAQARERADTFMTFAEAGIDKGQLFHEHARGLAAAKPGAALLGLGIAAAMKGRNWTAGLLAIVGDDLARFEGVEKGSEKRIHELIMSGATPMKLAWSVSLTEVPDTIEVSGAGDHMAGVTADQANRVEDVYFMHRGRRMVVGRFFNLVRDAATIHQYNVREFVLNAKQVARARLLGEDQAPESGSSVVPEKGFDL